MRNPYLSDVRTGYIYAMLPYYGSITECLICSHHPINARIILTIPKVIKRKS